MNGEISESDLQKRENLLRQTDVELFSKESFSRKRQTRAVGAQPSPRGRTEQLFKHHANEPQPHQPQRHREAAHDPFAANPLGESRGHLRAEYGADGKRYDAAQFVVKQAGRDVCRAAREGGDRQDKQRGRGGGMNWEAKGIHERGHIEKPPADAEEAGDKPEHRAYARTGDQGGAIQIQSLCCNAAGLSDPGCGFLAGFKG